MGAEGNGFFNIQMRLLLSWIFEQASGANHVLREFSPFEGVRGGGHVEHIDIGTQRGKDHTSDSQRTSHDSPLYNKATTQKPGTVLSWKTPASISRSNFVRVSNLWRVLGGGSRQ